VTVRATNLKIAVLRPFLTQRQGNLPIKLKIARERHKKCQKQHNITTTHPLHPDKTSKTTQNNIQNHKHQTKISKKIKNKKLKIITTYQITQFYKNI
jgi:hypothetical protein